jgi:hypothetical protein
LWNRRTSKVFPIETHHLPQGNKIPILSFQAFKAGRSTLGGHKRSPTKQKRREISSLARNASDGAEVSLREPTALQEQSGKKKSARSVRNDG